MFKFRRFLAKAELFTKSGKQENAPDLVTLASFMLNVSWFGCVGAFILQEHRVGAFEIGGGWTNLLFLLSGIISCSLLIKSRTSLLFAGAGMGSIGFLFALPLFDRWANNEVVWRILGEEGEQVVMLLGFLLAYLFALSLIFLLLRFQAGNSRIWARHTLLTVQWFLLTISILLMFKHGNLAATPGGMTLALVIVILLFMPIALAGVLWHARQYDEQAKRKIFWAAFTVQLIVAIGAVYYYVLLLPHNVRNLM